MIFIPFYNAALPMKKYSPYFSTASVYLSFSIFFSRLPKSSRSHGSYRNAAYPARVSFVILALDTESLSGF